MNDTVKKLYPDFSINFVLTGEDRINARYVVECNWVEVDILADKDGLIVTMQKSEGHELIGELCHNWETTDKE